jgi:hypothetical protein
LAEFGWQFSDIIDGSGTGHYTVKANLLRIFQVRRCSSSMAVNRPPSPDKLTTPKQWCRGRDSNPHGAFAPENFKSSEYSSNYVKLLGFFARLGENV